MGFKNHVAGNGTIVGLDGYNLAWANTLPPDSSDVELPQEIEWGLPANLRFGGDPVQLLATATSGDPVAYEVVEGPAQIVDGTLTLLGTGTVIIRASQAGDEHYAPVSTLFQFEAMNAPTVEGAPADQLAFVGAEVTFSVEASGGSLSYQWRKDGQILAGATQRELIFNVADPAAAGAYDVVVQNVVGSTVSIPATLTVWNWAATHVTTTDGFESGGTVTVNSTLTYSGPVEGLTWSVLMPRDVAGTAWTLVEATGDSGAISPTVGDTELLEWSWTTMPASPIAFSYTLAVPAGTQGVHRLRAMVTPVAAGAEYEALVRPAPLVLTAMTSRYSADVDGDQRISLSELLRVIELYNTRSGTTRTGRYRWQDGTADGFNTDPRAEGESDAGLELYHTADFNEDARLSLSELLRVIELYNFREGTTRTGRYRPRSGTIDGFAPGGGE